MILLLKLNKLRGGNPVFNNQNLVYAEAQNLKSGTLSLPYG
jgi:hypothetical protein